MTGLEALKTIILGTNVDTYRSSVDEIDNAISIIEKELKALEIIKNKDVNIIILPLCKNVEEYNYSMMIETRYLTKKEFKLLKEVL